MGGKYDFWYPAFDTLESAERISRTQRATQGKFSLHLHYGPDTLPLESSIATISYDHIPSIHKFGNDKIEIKSVNASTNAKKVGYVAGAGDKMAEATTSLGAEVEMIDHTTVSVEDLAKFDAVVFGIRALNVHADIDQHIQKFYDYAEAGGTLIMQYNTSHRLKTKNLQGLTLSRDRVTEEVAAVNVINKHQVLAFPNKITTEDWDNWVQERGLYFPNKWDDSFVPILTMNDSGESPKSGSLLIKPMGKGYFVYTGISFFRELPAGVNGAYKLWGNILSLKGN
jgi:hypothetical protein